jgi:hypothetical protein
MESVSFDLTLIVPIVVVLVGIGICFFGAYRWQQFNAVAAWASTNGKVLRSQLQTSNDETHADIEYEYRVIGTRYTSTRIAAGMLLNPQDAVSTYAVGATVTVFYNPDNPADAILERGSNVLALALIGAGAIDIAVGIGLFLYFGF